MTTRYSQYQKRWLLDQSRGIDRSYIDAAIVRAHLSTVIAAGVKLSTVAHVTGCSKSTIRAIAEGRTKGCQQAIALRVLAVTVEGVLNATALNPRAHVPAIGACRRVRALQSIGHTFDCIRAIAGCDVSQVVESSSVALSTHQGVVRAYNALSMTPGHSQHNRTWAARRGWPPPLAWDDDDLDDPNARPALTPKGRGQLVEDIELVAASGAPWDAAAARLGTTRTALDRRLHRLGRHDLAARFTRNSETWRVLGQRNQWSA